jgi:hypothetical protein
VQETVELFDASKTTSVEKTVAPLEEQQVNESRRFWHPVTTGMLSNNEESALNEKRKIEAVQRRDEQERHKTNTPWVPRLFKPHNNFYYYSQWG